MIFIYGYIYVYVCTYKHLQLMDSLSLFLPQIKLAGYINIISVQVKKILSKYS